eukprot:PLAT8596.1.p3 GENE.PLAT8596.1~~PLAT8596.1.p3  ORF type:complete len:219 (+),score=91.08 PLAT8596.1:537-1193(+)
MTFGIWARKSAPRCAAWWRRRPGCRWSCGAKCTRQSWRWSRQRWAAALRLAAATNIQRIWRGHKARAFATKKAARVKKLLEQMRALEKQEEEEEYWALHPLRKWRHDKKQVMAKRYNNFLHENPLGRKLFRMGVFKGAKVELRKVALALDDIEDSGSELSFDGELPGGGGRGAGGEETDGGEETEGGGETTEWETEWETDGGEEVVEEDDGGDARREA